MMFLVTMSRVLKLARQKNVSLLSEQAFFLGNHALRKNADSSLNDITSISQKYMIATGLIQHIGASGLFALSPILMRSLSKMSAIVDTHMASIGAQKMLMPLLCPEKLWHMSGRDKLLGKELMRSTDSKGNKMCLSPTFEELITYVVASSNLSARQLPLALYQTGPKFRDEPRPKHGLLRCREFVMKDMYSFHETLDQCREFYDQVRQVYRLFLSDIGFEMGVTAAEVEAPSGAMGGNLSHEFHVLADIGEDTILKCSNCASFYHPEVHSQCPSCSSAEREEKRAIEVGHTFILGQRYSQVFDCAIADNKPNPEKVYPQMGCYGLGLSRLLSACIESYFHNNPESSSLESFVWPKCISPYSLAVLMPKKGNREEDIAETVLLSGLESSHNSFDWSDVILDDRSRVLLGKKMKDVKYLGVPFFVVLGRSLNDEKATIEVIDRQKNETSFVYHEQFLSTLQQLC